jgi:hypothetical protein
MKGQIDRIVILFSMLSGFAGLVSAQETNLTVSAEDSAALILRIPQAARVTTEGNHTLIETTNLTLHLWPISKAKAIDEVLPLVAETIKGEFVNFKPNSTNSLLVAGAPAWHILGKGNEADDGDPGAAEVVIFKTGKRVFVACVHGEFDDAARRSKPMMAVLQTSKAP